MNTTIVLLIVLVVLLVVVLIGLVILSSSIRRNRKEIKEVASGLSVLAQVSDKNADLIATKTEKDMADLFSELGEKVNISPKYDGDNLDEDVRDFMEVEGQISIYMIQRIFNVGYATATKVIKDLKEEGVIERIEKSKDGHVCWKLVNEEEEEEEEDETTLAT